MSADVEYRASSLDVYPTYGQPQQAWILGRAETSSYFGCRLEYNATEDTTKLFVTRWTETSEFDAVQDFFTGPIELGVYYHLSLRLDGDTGTCRASSATHAEVSTSIVDDGSMGTKLTGTHAGLRFNGAVSFHPYFDDFRVEGL